MRNTVAFPTTAQIACKKGFFNFGQLVDVSIMNSSLLGIAHVYL